MIEKKPEKKDNYLCKMYGYKNARTAFKDILLNLKNITILIPAFIGFSPKEGSGVFDPIIETGIKYEFYKVTDDLFVDVEDLKKRVFDHPGKKALLVIHYYGYVDPQYKKIIKICKENEIDIIEDCAHALFTEYCKYSIGKEADYLIYSIHKLFPFKKGGILKVRDSKKFLPYHNENMNYQIFDYEWKKIADKRIRNAKYLEKRLEGNKKIKILRRTKEFVDSVPQSFPILLEEADRFEVYTRMNEIGYGVVSLYHTLIEPLRNENYFRSKKIADNILNLPLHQDISEEELGNMCEKLEELVNGK